MEDAPAKFGIHKGRPHWAYDLRGMVDEIEGLVVIVQAGLDRASCFGFTRGRYRSGMEFPWRVAANRRLVAAPTWRSVAHEAAHLVLGHKPDGAYVPDGQSYDNHPNEIEANIHESLAVHAHEACEGIEEQAWDAPYAGDLIGSRKDFVGAVLGLYPQWTRGRLLPSSREIVMDRLGSFWDAVHGQSA